MKTGLIILTVLVLIVLWFGSGIFVSRRADGVSGESITIGQSLIVAEYGYADGGNRLLYAVIRSFPTNASPQQKSQDPRYSEIRSGVLVRDKNGRMIPVGHDGTVYLFEGDRLRTMKVNVAESDIGIGRCRSMDEIWEQFRQFEVRTNK